MEIDLFYDYTGKQVEKTSQFFSFKKIQKRKLTLDMKKECITDFVKMVNWVRTLYLPQNHTHKCDFNKFPFLYKALVEDGIYKMPFVFNPNGKQCAGHGRGLISSIYFPDNEFDFIFYEKNIGDFSVVENVVDSISKTDYWKNINLSNKKATCIVESLDNINYIKCVEFDDITFKGSGYNGEGFYLGNLDQDTELWEKMYSTIKEVSLDNIRDYKNLLDKIIQIT